MEPIYFLVMYTQKEEEEENGSFLIKHKLKTHCLHVDNSSAIYKK